MITPLSPLGTTEALASGASFRMGNTGRIFLDIPGHGGLPILDRYNRTEVAERHLADWRGERGAAFVAAVRAGDVRAQRRTWRAIGV